MDELACDPTSSLLTAALIRMTCAHVMLQNGLSDIKNVTGMFSTLRQVKEHLTPFDFAPHSGGSYGDGSYTPSQISMYTKCSNKSTTIYASPSEMEPFRKCWEPLNLTYPIVNYPAHS